MAPPKLVLQTTYAELLERCTNAAFDDAFAEDGAFIAKTVKARKYWYFQTGAGEDRSQRYVGPETPNCWTEYPVTSSIVTTSRKGVRSYRRSCDRSVYRDPFRTSATFSLPWLTRGSFDSAACWSAPLHFRLTPRCSACGFPVLCYKRATLTLLNSGMPPSRLETARLRFSRS